ncbi:hypothetical protein BST61_g11316 [Cercospora zeina]
MASPNSRTTSAPNSTATTNQEETSTLSLRNTLESLPQELYNEIYKLTFTAPKPTINLLQLSYIPRTATTGSLLPYLPPQQTRHQHQPSIIHNNLFPHLLHIDRHSRAQYAKSHFGSPQTIFVICSTIMLESMLETIHKDHLTMIGRVYLRDVMGEEMEGSWKEMIKGMSRYAVVWPKLVLRGLEKRLSGEFGAQVEGEDEDEGEE